MKKAKYQFLLMFIVLNCQFVVGQQNNNLSIGFNATYLTDWKRLEAFNPEVSYAHLFSGRYGFNYTLNTLYGENLSKANMKEKATIYRLFFSNDLTFDYKVNNFIFSAGPSARYRNEKQILYFYPQPNPFEFIINPIKSHWDAGLALKSSYEFHFKKKSLVAVKLSYRLYNNGVDPASLGLFYGRRWR